MGLALSFTFLVIDSNFSCFNHKIFTKNDTFSNFTYRFSEYFLFFPFNWLWFSFLTHCYAWSVLWLCMTPIGLHTSGTPTVNMILLSKISQTLIDTEQSMHKERIVNLLLIFQANFSAKLKIMISVLKIHQVKTKNLHAT